MIVVVDTSLFVAALKGGELRSVEARQFFRAIDKPESLVIPLTVLVELGAVMKRQTGSTALAERVVTSVQLWPSISIVADFSQITEQLVELSTTSGLRGMDVMVLATAVAFGLPLLTYDREMARRGNVFTRIVSPQDILDDLVDTRG